MSDNPTKLPKVLTKGGYPQNTNRVLLNRVIEFIRNTYEAAKADSFDGRAYWRRFKVYFDNYNRCHPIIIGNIPGGITDIQKFVELAKFYSKKETESVGNDDYLFWHHVGQIMRMIVGIANPNSENEVDKLTNSHLTERRLYQLSLNIGLLAAYYVKHKQDLELCHTIKKIIDFTKNVYISTLSVKSLISPYVNHI